MEKSVKVGIGAILILGGLYLIKLGKNVNIIIGIIFIGAGIAVAGSE